MTKKKQNRIKLAVDVNTKRTGWSVWVNGVLQGYGTVITGADTTKGMGMPMYEDYYSIMKVFAPILMNIRKAIDEEEEKSETLMMIGIENSKIRVGADTQQKMDMYAGMYLGYFAHSCRSILHDVKVNVKMITANWQEKIFEKGKVDSKDASREHATKLIPADHKDLTKENDPGGDKADAINIGFLLEDLVDHGVAKWIKGNKKKNHTRIKAKLQNSKEKLAEYKLRSAERIKKGLPATDAQLALRIQRKEEEIQKYEQELATWK